MADYLTFVGAEGRPARVRCASCKVRTGRKQQTINPQLDGFLHKYLPFLAYSAQPTPTPTSLLTSHIFQMALQSGLYTVQPGIGGSLYLGLRPGPPVPQPIITLPPSVRPSVVRNCFELVALAHDSNLIMFKVERHEHGI